MTLNEEWRPRVEAWLEALTKLFYRELGEVELSGFTTMEQLTAEEAERGPFAPMPPATKWGAKWEYGWFRCSLVLPREAEGERIVLRLKPGGESLVFVDGVARGSVDEQHKQITLSRSASAGERYEILLEAYAGHGRHYVGLGPVLFGEVTIPEPPPTQTSVGRSSFGIWDEEVYQLWLDAQTLLEARDGMDQESLRVAELDCALREFALIVDPELERREMLSTVRAGRKRLRPLLECVNGSTAPRLFAFGHAHIDVAWLWPVKESERKIARTISNQLSLLEEYPEYRFLQSQAFLYETLERLYPALYERTKRAVRDGGVIPEGGMYVEADTNLAGGESLIRQFLHGKRFYKEAFGSENELLWLPDVFGYSGALPQILRGCGINYFSTAKILWNYHGGAPFPYNTFHWEGIDGSRVLTHLCNDYNSEASPTHVLRRWTERVQKDGIYSRPMPFGWGDGGGGPTRDHLEFLRRQRDLEGLPRTCMASPLDYFRDLEGRGVPNAVYVGELYYQCHRGTYTSQAKTKKGNRKAELALREAEMWAGFAAALKGFKYSAQELQLAWKRLLVNQFHDILPGSAIERAHQVAEADFQEVIQTASRATAAVLGALAKPHEASVTVFNSLCRERTALVELPEGFEGAAQEEGETLPVQTIAGRSLAEVRVPACGWTTLHKAEPSRTSRLLKASPTLLENEFLRVEFNASGEIVSIVDKETATEFADGPCNSFQMFKDVPSQNDAWDIDSFYAMTPVPLGGEATVEVVAEGPLVAAVRISRKLLHSDLTQEVRLRRGSRTVEFETTIDWREDHKLLKVAFPTNIHTSEVINEIQFGHIRRPNHKSRPFDADRFEVCNHKWSAVAEEDRGFALLNDCKYGMSCLGGTMSLTLLKSPLAPDMHCDRGRQDFTYAFHVWSGSLADSRVVQEAYELNCPVLSVPGAGGEASVMSVDAPNVIIETIKLAEDGSGDLIVRLYEAKRMATRCTLTTVLPAVSARQVNMLEEVEHDLELADGRVSLELRPFEIKTVRLALERGQEGGRRRHG